jgi:uncharacterized membrane protein
VATFAIVLLVGVIVVPLLWVAVVSVRRYQRELMRKQLLRVELLQAEVFRVEGRRRKRLRSELLHYSEYVRAIADLCSAIEGPPPDSPQAQLRDTARILASEDVAILAIAGGIRDMWPRRSRTLRPGPDDETLKPAQEVLAFLDRNALVVTGMEQVFFNLVSLSETHSAALSVVIQQVGGVVPEPLHGAAANVIHAVVAGQVGPALHGPAGDVLRGVAGHFMVAAIERSPGALGGVFKGGELLNIATHGTLAGAGEHLIHRGGEAVIHAALHSGVPQGVDVLSHVTHAETAVAGLSVADGLGAHFPWITLALAVTREGKLLKEGKTTPKTAAKNAALDISGGLGGAVAGAAVGGLIVPVAGHVVGAIIGAWRGRKATNRLKETDLRRAEEQLALAEAAAPERFQTLATTVCEAILKKYDTSRGAFINAVGAPPLRNGDRAGEWRTVAVNLLDAAQSEAERVRATVAIARQWAPGDHGLAAGLARVGVALDISEGAVTGANERLERDYYADSIVAVAASPCPLPPAICQSEEQQLQSLAEDRRATVARWTLTAADHFKEQKKLFEANIAPDCRLYQQGCEQLERTLDAAQTHVRTERDKLGH